MNYIFVSNLLIAHLGATDQLKSFCNLPYTHTHKHTHPINERTAN